MHSAPNERQEKHAVGRAALWAAACLLLSSWAAAQTMEVYNQAAAALKNAQNEKACDQFKLVTGGPAETETLRNRACQAAEIDHRNEERYFKEGEQAFLRKDYATAKKMFAIAQGIKLERPTYKSQIESRLAEIAKLEAGDELMKKEKEAYDAALKDFNAASTQGELERARQRVQSARDMGRTYQKECDTILTQIDRKLNDLVAAAEQARLSAVQKAVDAGDPNARDVVEEFIKTAKIAQNRTTAQGLLAQLKTEQALFDQASQAFDQRAQAQQREAARRDLQQAVNKVRNRTHKSEAQRMLAVLQKEDNDAALAGTSIDRAKQARTAGNLQEALNQVDQVIKMPTWPGDAPIREEAQSLAQSLQAELKRQAERAGRVQDLLKQAGALLNKPDLRSNAKTRNDARSLCQQVNDLDSENKTAKDCLNRIAVIEVEANSERAFQDAVENFKQGKFAVAQSLFTLISKSGGARASEAGKYVVAINKETADLGLLKEGLTEFLKGHYPEAYDKLNKYIEGKGRKHDLAVFFRGASAAGLYFLSGKKDEQQRRLAMTDFAEAKLQPVPDSRFVPRSILELRDTAR